MRSSSLRAEGSEGGGTSVCLSSALDCGQLVSPQLCACLEPIGAPQPLPPSDPQGLAQNSAPPKWEQGRANEIMNEKTPCEQFWAVVCEAVGLRESLLSRLLRGVSSRLGVPRDQDSISGGDPERGRCAQHSRTQAACPCSGPSTHSRARSDFSQAPASIGKASSAAYFTRPLSSAGSSWPADWRPFLHCASASSFPACGRADKAGLGPTPARSCVPSSHQGCPVPGRQRVGHNGMGPSPLLQLEVWGTLSNCAAHRLHITSQLPPAEV